MVHGHLGGILAFSVREGEVVQHCNVATVVVLYVEVGKLSASDSREFWYCDTSTRILLCEGEGRKERGANQ